MSRDRPGSERGVEAVSGYRNGADLERAVKHHLEDNGYLLVIKSGGSKGKVDVIGLKRGETVLVQCKTTSGMSPADRIKLRKLALDLGAVPVYACWVKEGNAARTIGYTELISMGPAGNRPWTPDHAITDALASTRADATRTG
jgi:Holliday junction resolvase-like predicted endonuclease